MEIELPFEPTNKQLELYYDPHRFKVAVWGRRSGKSTFALNLAIRVCMEKPGAKVWIVLPTYGQAKDIYWNDAGMIDRYIIPEMQATTNISDLSIKFPNQSIIQFKGADNFDSLRGSGLDLLICDEFSEWRYAERAWLSLRPALSDKQGIALFIGTPKGDNYFKKLFDLGQVGGDPQWRSWRIPTWESGAPWTLTEDGQRELEELRQQKSEDWFMQEYGAEFRKYTGLIFKSFDTQIHVKEFNVSPRAVIECGMDFGWNDPTVNLFAYFDDDRETCYVFDEYYDTRKTTREHAGKLHALRNVYKDNRVQSIVGDSQAKQTIQDFAEFDWYITPTTQTDKQILAGIERIQDALRINYATSEPRLIIHPRCTNLIQEMQLYRWKENKLVDGESQEIPEPGNDHCIDALRYIFAHHKRVGLNKVVPKAVQYSYKPQGGNY